MWQWFIGLFRRLIAFMQSYIRKRTAWMLFTERARRAVFYSQEEARDFGYNLVTPTFLLLGILRDETNSAYHLLSLLNLTPADLSRTVRHQIPRGNGPHSGEDMLLTPMAKRAIDRGFDEAQALTHDFIGTEHLLLGILMMDDKLATLFPAGTAERFRAAVAEYRRDERSQ